MAGGLVVAAILATTLDEPSGAPSAVPRAFAWALAHGAVPLLFAGAWMIYGFVRLRVDSQVLLPLGAVCTVWGWAIANLPTGMALGLAAMAVGNGMIMAGDVVRRSGRRI